MTIATLPRSRRSFLAAGSAGAVLATLGAAAAAEAPALDPVFAAIERHKALEIDYLAASHLTDEVSARQEGRVITEFDESVMDFASESLRNALDDLLATVPQTKSGCRAAIAYFAKIDWCGEYAVPFMATLLQSPAIAG